MQSARRVVVTGLGIVSPIGNSIESAWDNLTNGRSGIGPITHFDPENFATKFAGQVRDFDVTQWVPLKDARRMDPFIHYGIAAGIEAVRDAGFDTVPEAMSARFGAAIAAGIGGISTIENTTLAWKNGGPRKISPFFVPGTIINMVAGHLAIMLGLRGPNLSIVTACTTATHNIGVAARLIAYGDADLMLTGGAEHATTPTAIGGFSMARALSERNNDPTAASRPWDQDRDGFVLSDGAGALLLEEYEHAKARGAKIYAEIAGFGMSDDAYHMTAPPEDGSGAAASMTAAMRDAGVTPEQVQYVNAHATSTPLGDRAELVAIRRAFGSARPLVSSTKSVTGHLLGAAGAVEAIFSVLALKFGVVPATINLHKPDEGIEFDLVANTARHLPLDIVMSNSFGFGGTNGTLVFKRV